MPLKTLARNDAAELAAERRRAAQKIVWRINEWAEATGVCRGTVNNLLRRGELESVKAARMRLITTTPDEWLAAKAAEQ